MIKYLPVLAVLFILTPTHAQWPGQSSGVERSIAQDKTGRPDTKRFGTVIKGNSATGGDGCYLGECGDKETTPPPKPKPKPQPTEESDPDGLVPPQRPAPQMPLTNICQTPGFWCTMIQPSAPGISCYCNLPYPMGFANGITILPVR